MLLTILFGILAAVAWGTADFEARNGAFSLGFVPTLMGMNAVGAVVLALLAATAGPPGLSLHQLGVLVLLASGNTGAGLLFYYALEHGQLSLVSPITAAYPAVSALLAWFLAAQRLGPLLLIAVLVVIAGTMVVTRGGPEVQIASPRQQRALLAAAAGSVIFGVVFYFLARLGAHHQFLLPILVFRWFGVLVLTPFAFRRRSPRQIFSHRAVWTTGLLDTFAYLVYVWGAAHGLVAVIAAVSGLFSVWTIVLAIVFLKERLNRSQWAGVTLILTAITVLALGR